MSSTLLPLQAVGGGFHRFVHTAGPGNGLMGRRVEGRWVDGSMGPKGSQTTEKSTTRGQPNAKNGAQRVPGNRFGIRKVQFSKPWWSWGSLSAPQGQIFVPWGPWGGTLGTQGDPWRLLWAPKGQVFNASGAPGGTLGTQGAKSHPKSCEPHRSSTFFLAERCQNLCPSHYFWINFGVKKHMKSRIYPRSIFNYFEVDFIHRIW